jgi:hypothetical protein
MPRFIALAWLALLLLAGLATAQNYYGVSSIPPTAPTNSYPCQQSGTTGTWQICALGIPQNAKSAAYTLALSDNTKHIYATGSVTYAITIPANASVAFPIGTAITIVCNNSAGITIPITSDTLIWSPAGTTGTRTCAQYGMVTILKVGTTTWWISGGGLT